MGRGRERLNTANGDHITPLAGRWAVSPRIALGRPGPAGPPLLAPLNNRLNHWVQAKPVEVLAEWRKRDALQGREVTWEGGSGVADGVDDRGYLVVITPSGDRIAIGAGEVHLTSF